MTSIAMIAGMTPVAMGWAGDPSFRSPMGVAVIGGLFVSTFMSLFIVPPMFSVVDDFQLWLARKLGAGSADAMPAAPPSAQPAGTL
jgi:Cu/Ag efflux pump CusA